MSRFTIRLRRLALLAAGTLAVLCAPQPAGAADVPATAAEVSARIAKARELVDRGRTNEADQSFAVAADAAHALSNGELEIAALKGRFDTLGHSNDWVMLRVVAVRLLAVQQRAGDDDGAADTEQDIGSVESMLGNYGQADYHFQRVSAYWAERGVPKRRAETQLNLAKTREMEGRIPEAWALAESARDAFQALGDRELESEALRVLAGIELVVGDFADARALASRSLALLGEDSDATDAALARGLIAIADYETEHFAEARKSLLELLDFFQSAHDADGECQALLHLSTLEARDHRFESALSYARRARARAGDSVELEGWAFASMGDADVGLKGYESAFKDFASALAIGEKIQSPSLVLDVRRGMARAYLARGDLENAIDHARRACDLLESFVAGLDDHHRTAIRASTYSEAYDLGIQAALARKDVAAFTEFVERQRAGSLLQGLGGRRLLRGVGLPATLAAAEQQAHEALVAVEARYRALCDGGAPLEELRLAVVEKAAAERNYEDVVARIQRDAHREASVAYPVHASLAELKALIWPGEALVLYALVADRMIAVVVTGDDARLVDVGSNAEVERAVAGVVDVGAGVDGLTSEKLLLAAKAVFSPLGLPDTVKRVLVSPDGILANAPITAMIAALSPADRAVSLVPSGSTYRLLLEDRRRTGTRVLAIGDPTYPAPDDALPRAYALRGRVLSPLPGSRAEVLGITQEGRDVRLLGAEATKTGVLDALARNPKGERWRAVHFACHCLLNRERPGFCALALTPGPGPTEDGLLSVHEIFASHISAELVVLSACETALGRADRGEGILGFTRAFFNAGAPRVVVSLWPVDDDSTREMMTAFYAALATGAPHADALRDAQAHTRKFKKWAHPRYWAAWTLWGLPD